MFVMAKEPVPDASLPYERKKSQVLAANADEAASALNEDLAFGGNLTQAKEVVKRDSVCRIVSR